MLKSSKLVYIPLLEVQCILTSRQSLMENKQEGSVTSKQMLCRLQKELMEPL